MEVFFEDRESWRKWLDEHHDEAREVWLVFCKKHTGKLCISYDAAVEEALCLGWIDSILKRLDEDRYARKFTPRTNTSKWSALNLKRVKKLVASGRMTEAGLTKVAVGVKPEAPVSTRPVDPPPFFAQALAENQAARDFFNQLAPSYRRNYVAWLISAKGEETRKKRLAEAIARLSEGKRLGLK
jgi:uncharacterized protein YdeI (YjbR/CyaY-like superfamily)